MWLRRSFSMAQNPPRNSQKAISIKNTFRAYGVQASGVGFRVSGLSGLEDSCKFQQFAGLRNPKPRTRDIKPQTRNPKPQTRNPKPQTPNSRFQSPHSEPQTQAPSLKLSTPESQPPKPRNEPQTSKPQPSQPRSKPQSRSAKRAPPHHSRANLAHTRQSRPDSGLGLQVRVLTMF